MYPLDIVDLGFDAWHYASFFWLRIYCVGRNLYLYNSTILTMYIMNTYRYDPNAKRKRIRNKIKKYEDELIALRTQLDTLRSERLKVKWDNTIPTYDKNKQLRSIERKGKSVKRKINRIENQKVSIQAPKTLNKISNAWAYTTCYLCDASINKKESSRCPKCNWYRCPKCFACLCSYIGKSI